MNPVFYQYQREKNILDNLIQEFIKRNWLFDEMPNDYFHQYRWPDIVLSDKEATYRLPNYSDLKKEHPYTIELLGCYTHDDNPEKEGNVILYMPRIQQTALNFAVFKTGIPQSSFSEEDKKHFVELLTTLILIHEFTHWVMHWGNSPNIFVKNQYNHSKVIEYNSIESIQFHETIAQVLTNYFCAKNESLWELFLWLSNRQPPLYNQYRDLLWGDAISENKVQDTDLDSFIECLKKSRFYNLQDYRYFIVHYNLLKNGKVEKDLYKTALEHLKLQDLFIDELEDSEYNIDTLNSITNYKNAWGHLVLVYKEYLIQFYESDEKECLLEKLNDVLAKFYPWSYSQIRTTFIGTYKAKKFVI
jgi:hypothetical protein